MSTYIGRGTHETKREYKRAYIYPLFIYFMRGTKYAYEKNLCWAVLNGFHVVSGKNYIKFIIIKYTIKVSAYTYVRQS